MQIGMRIDRYVIEGILGEGAMAALLGLDPEDVRAVAEAAAQGEVCTMANDNAPGQVVIAGDTAAVEDAMEQAKALGARMTRLLPVSVPCHCSLLKDSARQLAEELESISIEMPRVPIIHNQSATIADSVDEIRDTLQLQLYQPVKWVASVELMSRRGIAALIECGPGKVLTGLTRRIDKALKGYAIFDFASLESTQQSIGEE